MNRKSWWRISGQQGIRIIANEHKYCGANKECRISKGIKATTWGCPYVEQGNGAGFAQDKFRRNDGLGLPAINK